MRKALNQTIMILTPAFEVHSGRFDCFAHFDFNYGIYLKKMNISVALCLKYFLREGKKYGAIWYFEFAIACCTFQPECNIFDPIFWISYFPMFQLSNFPFSRKRQISHWAVLMVLWCCARTESWFTFVTPSKEKLVSVQSPTQINQNRTGMCRSLSWRPGDDGAGGGLLQG